MGLVRGTEKSWREEESLWREIRQKVFPYKNFTYSTAGIV